MPSQRPSKRQRIFRACDQCRRRKSKCDGGQPACSICRTANRTCSYQNGGGRRGLPPGYVRSLEMVLGLVLQNVPNSEKTVHDLLTKSRNNNHFLARDPAIIWRQSQLAKDLSKLIDHDSQEVSTMTVPDESEWDTLEMINTPGVVNAGTEPATSGTNKPALQQRIQTIGTGQMDYAYLPFPSDTLSMLENYFTYTHCWFPILERRDLFRTMHTSLGPEASLGHDSSLVLWAVVAYESAAKDDPDPRQPGPLQIQQSIYARAMTNSTHLELGHIQTVIVLALLQLKLGDIKNSWRLAGQASRMLATLPMTSRNNRYHNTFHGCIFLDNILSAVLSKTPCMSLEEQQEEGPISEDNIEEWDVWSVSLPASEGCRNTPKGPLRALSIFNNISKLMNYLARIFDTSTNMLRADERGLSANLQAVGSLQNIFVEKYPHTGGSESNTPPLLTLHLTSFFVMLESLKRSLALDMGEKALVVNLVRSSVNLLDKYLEITGALQISPLLSCFALQCQQCFNMVHPDPNSGERQALENRLCPYLQSLEAGTGSLQRSINLRSARAENARMDPPYNGFVQSSDLHVLETRPENSIIAPPANPAADSCVISAFQSPAGVTIADDEGFDALFEEMVTSIPINRQQPLFAQNLGFYAGNLDKDFLEQLQQPADG
ncbi:hypothetical protein N7517_010968 [Penicillium concentricum]|uniref:Zn(2)-C6 fungal-type domain-containing protein n=1 Tax=Penicillium concentricum TaxID=293559 RepID=A0A9W9RCI3_9EURO|nr:uncharacterized protein N7517_010968 [Penicillium concentricum]KAJ5356359.1 hypothetical protein N7517_010968 [Penicillium concentricum]